MATSPHTNDSGLLEQPEDVEQRYASTLAALRQMEERYRLVADNVQDLITLHDQEGAFLYVSPSVRSMLGYEPHALIGRSVYELVFEDDLELLRTAHAAIARRDGRAPAVYRVRRFDGTVIWCETTARVALDEATGAPSHIIAVTRDITERRAFEQHMMQSQKMEALGRLAGGIAHDFNNVLTVIAGHAELLTSLLDDGTDERDHAEFIREASHRAAMLTRQLLSFGRGKGRDAGRTDLNACLLDIQPMLARLIGSAIELRHQLDPDLLAIRCDQPGIEQILVNLAVNARDAMPDGGTLTFRTCNVTLGADDHAALPPGRYVQLTVKDTGVGMSREVAARAFEPFFTTRDADAGTGLGLSTVYSIMRQVSGDVSLQSSPGAGTVFRLLFPGHDAPAEPATAEPARSNADLQGRGTVLVAEDDPGVRALVVATLQRYGYQVMAAVDGLQALELFRTYGHVIDVIVTDVNMPELKGPELIAAVNAGGGDVPVLYISGFTAETLRLRDGAPRHAFLAKPFAPVDLARAVKRLRS